MQVGKHVHRIFALLSQRFIREVNNSLYLTNKRLSVETPLLFKFQVQSRVLTFHVRRAVQFLEFWQLSDLIPVQKLVSLGVGL